MLLFQTNPSFQMLLSIRKLYLTFNLLKYSKFTPNVREEKESSFHDCSESNIMQYGITTFVMSSFDSVSIFISSASPYATANLKFLHYPS